MKVIVCKGCGQRMMARDMKTNEPACTTCIGISKDSGIPIEVEVDLTKATCIHCNKLWIENHIPPFYDSTNNTYYCGCWGWD